MDEAESEPEMDEQAPSRRGLKAQQIQTRVSDKPLEADVEKLPDGSGHAAYMCTNCQVPISIDPWPYVAHSCDVSSTTIDKNAMAVWCTTCSSCSCLDCAHLSGGVRFQNSEFL